jgi:hypothetical protein
MSRGDVSVDVHLTQRFDQFDFVSVGHLALNMAPNGFARKVLAARRPEEGERSRRAPLAWLALSSPPAGNLGLDLFAGREVSPTVAHAAAREGQDVGPVVIQAKQFHRRFVVRQAVSDELGDSVI